MRKSLSATQDGVALDDARIAAICDAETVRTNAAARPPKAAAEARRRHRKLSAEEREAKAARTTRAAAERKVEREAREWDMLQRRGRRRREAEERDRARQTRIIVAWRPGREPSVSYIDAAAAIVAEVGFQGLNYRDVIARVGGSPSTLSELLGGGGLERALIDRACADLLVDLELHLPDAVRGLAPDMVRIDAYLRSTEGRLLRQVIAIAALPRRARPLAERVAGSCERLFGIVVEDLLGRGVPAPAARPLTHRLVDEFLPPRLLQLAL